MKYELLWWGLILIIAAFVAAAFGGMDDADIRRLPEGTPHGVHGR